MSAASFSFFLPLFFLLLVHAAGADYPRRLTGRDFGRGDRPLVVYFAETDNIRTMKELHQALQRAKRTHERARQAADMAPVKQAEKALNGTVRTVFPAKDAQGFVPRKSAGLLRDTLQQFTAWRPTGEVETRAGLVAALDAIDPAFVASRANPSKTTAVGAWRQLLVAEYGEHLARVRQHGGDGGHEQRLLAFLELSLEHLGHESSTHTVHKAAKKWFTAMNQQHSAQAKVSSKAYAEETLQTRWEHHRAEYLDLFPEHNGDEQVMIESNHPVQLLFTPSAWGVMTQQDLAPFAKYAGQLNVDVGYVDCSYERKTICKNIRQLRGPYITLIRPTSFSSDGSILEFREQSLQHNPAPSELKGWLHSALEEDYQRHITVVAWQHWLHSKFFFKPDRFFHRVLLLSESVEDSPQFFTLAHKLHRRLDFGRVDRMHLQRFQNLLGVTELPAMVVLDHTNISHVHGVRSAAGNFGALEAWLRQFKPREIPRPDPATAWIEQNVYAAVVLITVLLTFSAARVVNLLTSHTITWPQTPYLGVPIIALVFQASTASLWYIGALSLGVAAILVLHAMAHTNVDLTELREANLRRAAPTAADVALPRPDHLVLPPRHMRPPVLPPLHVRPPVPPRYVPHMPLLPPPPADLDHIMQLLIRLGNAQEQQGPRTLEQRQVRTLPQVQFGQLNKPEVKIEEAEQQGKAETMSDAADGLVAEPPRYAKYYFYFMNWSNLKRRS